MGSPTTLVLECRRPSAAYTATTSTANSGCRSSNFTYDHHNIDDDGQGKQIHRIEEYLNALEEERKKIEVFKRELPLCMQLLQDAIQAYKERLCFYKPARPITNGKEPNHHDQSVIKEAIVVEECTPLKIIKPADGSYTDQTAEEKNICKPTISWMKVDCIDMQREVNSQEMCNSDLTIRKNYGLQCVQEQAFSTSSKPFFHSKNKSGGAFMPFNRDKLQAVVQPRARPGALNPSDLAFTPSDAKVYCNSPNNLSLSESPPPPSSSLLKLMKIKPKVENNHNELIEFKQTSMKGTDGSNGTSIPRKARRCWSPELHHRFVNALHQLGGPQVATPKQIRELMKVEGLTNDEVKSHLQKYRLHTRRPSPSPAVSAHTPQVVLVGGIWVPPEYALHNSTHNSIQNGIDQSPALYSASRPHAYQTPATSTSQEMCSQLESPEQINVQYCSSAPAHSQSSLRSATVRNNGQSSLVVYAHSDDVMGREESVGDDDDDDDENSSYKGLYMNEATRVRQNVAHVDMDNEDRSLTESINANRSHCTSDDDSDTEIEDRRDCDETSLELS